MAAIRDMDVANHVHPRVFLIIAEEETEDECFAALAYYLQESYKRNFSSFGSSPLCFLFPFLVEQQGLQRIVLQ